MQVWSNNNVVIKGPSQKILSLWNEIQQTKTLLNVLSPKPHNSYSDWEYMNWSTEWDVDTDNLCYEEGRCRSSYINGWFASSWNPPIKAYEKCCLDNKDIQIYSFYTTHQQCFGFLFEGINKEYRLDEMTKESLKYLFPKEILDEFTIEDEYEMSCEMLKWYEKKIKS